MPSENECLLPGRSTLKPSVVPPLMLLSSSSLPLFGIKKFSNKDDALVEGYT